MSEELKPCPFCGGDVINVHHGKETYWAMCNGCTSEGAPRGSRAGAAESWNTRPVEDALNARIRELEGWRAKDQGLAEVEAMVIERQAKKIAELTSHLKCAADRALSQEKRIAELESEMGGTFRHLENEVATAKRIVTAMEETAQKRIAELEASLERAYEVAHDRERRIAELTAELAAAREDSARLDWLETQGYASNGYTCREAIDAARKAGA